MHAGPELELWLADDHIERELEHLRRGRLARRARRSDRPWLRKTVGRWLIAIGQRLSAGRAVGPPQSSNPPVEGGSLT